MNEEDKEHLSSDPNYYRSLIEGFDEIYKICVRQIYIICILTIAVTILLVLLVKFR